MTEHEQNSDVKLLKCLQRRDNLSKIQYIILLESRLRTLEWCAYIMKHKVTIMVRQSAELHTLMTWQSGRIQGI